MPIVKTIEPEREQIPFYDSLSDEEIEAILESDSFSFNPGCNKTAHLIWTLKYSARVLANNFQ